MIVFIVIIKNILFKDSVFLYSQIKDKLFNSYMYRVEENDFYKYLKYVDKNLNKKQDIYFSLPSRYHQLLANYFLYPRRIYIDPRDIAWTNTIVSYETIPNIIYILESEKARINNILWISGGEGIEGIIMSRKDMKLARIDFLTSLEKWHSPGSLILEIYDNGRLIRKISNEKTINKDYVIEGRKMQRFEDELLSSSKFVLSPPIKITGYKGYDYKLFFMGNPNDLVGLSQGEDEGEVGAKKILYQLHPYYKLYKSYGVNKNIYNRG